MNKEGNPQAQERKGGLGEGLPWLLMPLHILVAVPERVQ